MERTMSDLDAKVKKLMDDVQERRKKVGSLKKPQWLTSCSLQLPGHDRLNIQICKDLGLLPICAAHSLGWPKTSNPQPKN